MSTNPKTILGNNKNGVTQIQKSTQLVDLRKELRQNIQIKELVSMREEIELLQC